MVRNFLDILKNTKSIAVFVYGEEGRVLYSNDAAARLFGYKVSSELIGKSFLEYISKEDLPEIQRAVDRRLSGEVFPAEYMNVTVESADGESRFVESFAYTITIKNKPAGLVIAIDRTKEKTLERLYRSLSEINQLIVRASDEIELLKKACEVLVNKAGYLATGVGKVDEKKKEVKILYSYSKNKNIKDIVKTLKISVDENKECSRGAIAEAYRNKDVAFRENVFRDPNLSCWYEYYNKLGIRSVCVIPALKKDKVEYLFFIADKYEHSFSKDKLGLLKEFMIDISYALDELELNRSSRLLQKAINESHEWALITDPSGKIVFANKSVESISKYKLSEILGKTPSIFKSGYHDSSFYENLWKTIKSGKKFSAIFLDKGKDGKHFYLDKTIVPILENGKIKNFVDLSKDITESVLKTKQLEMQSKIYNTLYRVSELSIKVSNDSNFLKKLPEIFTKYMNIDICYVVLIESGKLKIYSDSVLDSKFEVLIKYVEKGLNKEKITKITEIFPLNKSLKHGKVYIINDIINFIISNSENLRPIGDFLQLIKELKLHSCSSMPIKRGNKIVGSLILLSTKINLFTKDVYDLLNIIAKQISSSLNKFDEERFIEMAKTAMDNGFEFVVITDENFNIVYANNKALEASGYTKEELIGKHHSIFFIGEHDEEFTKNFYSTLKEGESYTNVFKYKTKDGSVKDFFVTILPFKKNGKITNYIAYGKQITDKESLEHRLNKLLYYDSLTGLLNVTSFKKAIDNYIKNLDPARGEIGAVCIINPINFKRVNEAFGYSQGDLVLKHIGERLKKSLKDYDVIAKLESDRFGILIKRLSNELDAIIVLDRLISELSKPYFIRERQISLSFNSGMSLIPRDGRKAEELLHKSAVALADASLIENKRIGFFSKKLEKKALERLSLKIELEKALENKQFVFYYQPYVDGNRTIVGAESLLRWDRGYVVESPAKFIDFLEGSELIVDVERSSIRSAVELIKKMWNKNKKWIPVSVNLSKRSLKNMNLFEEIRRLVKIYSIMPENIKFEIVERVFIDDFDLISDLINRIRSLGVSFYLDDFGTGFSSLSYLSNLPIDAVKIDISFTRKIIDDEKVRNIVNSIIFLSKHIGMKTIAEGVETEHQFELLKEMGCDYFQGYLFYRPMPENELLSLQF